MYINISILCKELRRSYCWPFSPFAGGHLAKLLQAAWGLWILDDSFTTHSLTLPFDSSYNRRELIQANPIYIIKGKQEIWWPLDLPAVVPLAHFECVTLTCKKRDRAPRGRCRFHVSTWHILALCLFCWSWFAIWREDGQGVGAKVVDCQAIHMIPWDLLRLLAPLAI